eukprot:6199541-Pleurochrysis_carterae.AAC.1
MAVVAAEAALLQGGDEGCKGLPREDGVLCGPLVRRGRRRHAEKRRQVVRKVGVQLLKNRNKRRGVIRPAMQRGMNSHDAKCSLWGGVVSIGR